MYCRHSGRLRKAYLGKGQDLSLNKLQSAARALAAGDPLLDTPSPGVALPPGTPLLASKLAPPPLRRRAVARPRLLDQLDAALAHPLTLVVAPAGAGKTSLLTQLQLADKSLQAELGPQANLHASATAWLSLDAHDNDPARFLTYLCAACERLHPGVGTLPLALLQVPQSIASETVLTMLLNGLGAAGNCLLVLDDYHQITNPTVHAALELLLDHQPTNLRLVIAARSEPPLPLARLRGRGQLAELRADNLRFTAQETQQFLTESMGLPATLAESEILERRTEGWAAGLHLAALVARQHANGLAALAHISGSQRAIVDYLTAEVLASQPPEVQRFLLLTAVLDRLCGPLCDTLLDIEHAALSVENKLPQPDPDHFSMLNAQFRLEALERASLFLVPLDSERHWYRYHQLFSDFLRDRLQRTAPELVAELHRRAAVWYAGAGLLSEAVEHGLLADDELAAELIERCGRALLMRSAVATVLGWLKRLPSSLVARRPQLGTIAAWALAAAGRLDEAALALDAVESSLGVAEDGQQLVGEVLAVRAAIAGLRRDLAATVALAEAALARLSPTQGYVRSVVAQLLGGAAHASGDPHGASRALAEAINLGQASGNLFMVAFSTRQLADVRAMQGRLAQAEQLYRQVLDVDSELLGLPVAGMAAVGMGELYSLRNDVQVAAQLIERGLAAGERGQHVEIIVRGCLALARLRAVAGDGPAARRLLVRAAQVASGIFWLTDWAQAEAARCNLLLGDRAAALAWAQTCGLSLADTPSYLYENNYLTLVRVANGSGGADLSLAERLLKQLWADAERSGRIGSLVEIGTLEALVLHSSGAGEAASAALLRALLLAPPGDYARIYLDGGTVLAALLRRILRHSDLTPELRAAINSLHATFAAPAPHRLPDSPDILSPRELEVLALLAAGRTNQQIAQGLVVSLGTVKKHLDNLYGKLGASSRTEAIARARELGITI